MRFYWERVENSRNFANKIWNASRFIMMNMEKADFTDVKLSDLTIADCWILSKVNDLAAEMTENMEKNTNWVLQYPRSMISYGKNSATGISRW